MTALSEKLHLETKDVVRDKQEADSLGITRIPAFVLQGRAKGAVCEVNTSFFEVLTAFQELFPAKWLSTPEVYRYACDLAPPSCWQGCRKE